MHRSAKVQVPPNAVDFLWSSEGMWKGLFLLCFLGQIVTWQYNPNPNWIKIDHVLLYMIMIDSCGSVPTFQTQKIYVARLIHILSTKVQFLKQIYKCMQFEDFFAWIVKRELFIVHVLLDKNSWSRLFVWRKKLNCFTSSLMWTILSPSVCT